QRGVAAREPRRSDEQVADRRDAEASELLGDRGREAAAFPDGREALEREARLAVVLGRAGPELDREVLGERDELLARAGARLQGAHAVVSISTGTPCVTMSNTAERCAARCTTSRSFSSGASPLTRNETRIRSKPFLTSS